MTAVVAATPRCAFLTLRLVHTGREASNPLSVGSVAILGH